MARRDTRQELERVRAELAALQEKREALSRRPPTLAEIERSVDAFIAARRTQADPIALGLFGRDPAPVRRLDEGVAGMRRDLEPWIAVLCGDQLRELLLREARAHVERLGAPLSSESLARELAAVDAEIHELEVQEEELIMASEAEGRPIVRRGDARPEIVLAAREEPALPPAA